MTLAETQALFWRALRGEAVDAESCFAGTPELPAAERVGIYSEMVVTRMIEALRADFPETAAAFGEDAFRRLAHQYVRELPSRSGDLGRLGAGFAAFCPPESRGLAELEWARAEVFVEADEQPLTPEQFQARVDPATFGELRPRLLRALRLVGATAVWRTGFEVNETTLPAAEARALRLAQARATLAEVCAPFETPDKAFAALRSWVSEGWLVSLD